MISLKLQYRKVELSDILGYFDGFLRRKGNVLKDGQKNVIAFTELDYKELVRFLEKFRDEYRGKRHYVNF